jgi:hypothetical protein
MKNNVILKKYGRVIYTDSKNKGYNLLPLNFKKIMESMFLISILFLQNCVSSPLIGFFVYSKQHVYNQVRGSQVTSNSIVKMGESCSFSGALGYLFLFYYGTGGSIEQAKEKAGITKIATIDRSSLVIGPFYYRDCIQVWGE